MPSLRVTILGCGASAGTPLIGGPDGAGDWGECDPTEARNRRTRASIVIESAEGARLLIDTGPELRSQLLAARIGWVDAILYTHAHADHVAGIDDVRALNRNIGRPLQAFADTRTLEELVRRYGYVFQPWQPPGFFRPVLQPCEVTPGATVAAAGLQVRVFDQDHGFSRSLGLRTGRFGYSTDVVALDEAAFEALRGIDTWVVGCFQRKRHNTHGYLHLVESWIARLNPRRTILTHMGNDLDWAWMVQNLPPGLEPAHDGMVVEIA